VARLLAAQMTAVKIGPGVEESKLKMERTTSKIEDDDEDETGGGSREEGKISTLIGGTASGTSEPSKSKKSGTKSTTVTLMPAGLSGKKSIKKTLKLTEITKRLSPEESSRQMTKAVERILKAERVALLGGVSEVRVKIITTLAARFPTSLKSSVLNFLFEDLNKRIELAFSWLYEEYCFCHSFHKAQWNRRTDDSEYNSIFCQLIHGVIEKTDGKDRQNLLRRLYLESPMITDDAIALLKQFVQVFNISYTLSMCNVLIEQLRA
jgi:symplekin